MMTVYAEIVLTLACYVALYLIDRSNRGTISTVHKIMADHTKDVQAIYNFAVETYDKKKDELREEVQKLLRDEASKIVLEKMEVEENIQ